MTPITWYITFKLDDRNFFSFFSLLYHHCRLWRAHLTLFRHHFFTPSLLPNTTSPCSLTMSKHNFWTLILGLHIHKLSRLNPHQHNQTPQLKNRDHTITKNIDLNMSTHTQKMNRKSIWKNQDKYNIKDENFISLSMIVMVIRTWRWDGSPWRIQNLGMSFS